MPKKRQASDSESDSDSGPEDRAPAKKAPEKKAPEKKAKTDKSSDEEKRFDLGKRKQVTVREFRGTLYIDIREFYEKDGELCPGKKGISLNVETWNKLKDLIPDIDEEISSH